MILRCRVHRSRVHPFPRALLLAAFLLALQPRHAWGEPVVEVVTQNTTVSTAGEPGSNWLPNIPLRITIGADVGYDDNIGTAGSNQGSLFATERITLAYNRPGGRTQLLVLTSAAFTDYFDATNAGSNEVSPNLTLLLTHQSSTRLSFAASVYATYQREPSFGSDVGPENLRANHFQTADSLAVTYRWLSRFTTVTSYNFQLIKYDESSIGIAQDRVDNMFGEQFKFALSPRTNLVGEYRFEIIDYDIAPRDSITHFVLAGVDHKFTRQLGLNASGGATFRSYKAGGDEVDPNFQGSLTYANTDRSSLTWTTAYQLEEPNLAGALVRTTFRTGLRLTYGLSGRISSTVAVDYFHGENQGPISTGTGSGVSQDSFNLSLGLGYKINQRFALNIAYNRSDSDSAGPTPAYSRNRYSAGLTFAY